MDNFTISFTAEKNGRLYASYFVNTEDAPPKELGRLKQAVVSILTEIDKAIKPQQAPTSPAIESATSVPDLQPPAQAETPEAPAQESEYPPPAAEPPRPAGVKGLLILRCPDCSNTFRTFLHDPQETAPCKCGKVIRLDNLAYFETTCPTCGLRTYGRTNLESADFHTKCRCGEFLEMEWDAKAKMYR